MSLIEMERVYVAGPYSADTDTGRRNNARRASAVGLAIMKRGHLAHVPHNATGPWHGKLSYERFMDLDLDILRRWATAIFVLAPSPGADRELEAARVCRLRVYTDLTQLPWR